MVCNRQFNKDSESVISLDTPWKEEGYCGPRTYMARAALIGSDVVDISIGPKWNFTGPYRPTFVLTTEASTTLMVDWVALQLKNGNEVEPRMGKPSKQTSIVPSAWLRRIFFFGTRECDTNRWCQFVLLYGCELQWIVAVTVAVPDTIWIPWGVNVIESMFSFVRPFLKETMFTDHCLPLRLFCSSIGGMRNQHPNVKPWTGGQINVPNPVITPRLASLFSSFSLTFSLWLDDLVNSVNWTCASVRTILNNVFHNCSAVFISWYLDLGSIVSDVCFNICLKSFGFILCEAINSINVQASCLTLVLYFCIRVNTQATAPADANVS